MEELCNISVRQNSRWCRSSTHLGLSQISKLRLNLSQGNVWKGLITTIVSLFMAIILKCVMNWLTLSLISFNGFLTGETEGLLIAAQDQALSTRAMQHISSAATSSLCRLCGIYDETVEHLVSGCSFLAVSQYTVRYNNVARHIHWSLRVKFDLNHSESSWNHCPPSVIENDRVKFFGISTFTQIEWSQLVVLT